MTTQDRWLTKVFSPYEVESHAVEEWLNQLEGEPNVTLVFADNFVVLKNGDLLVVVCVERKGGA